jgi:RNA polymerase sigma factor (sigma-70 family)
MGYRSDSIEGRFLSGDLEAVATVVRWISVVVASAGFWPLRPEWSDLQQEIMAWITESLRRERFDDSQDFRAYVRAVARYTMVRAMNSHGRTVSITVLEEEPPSGAPDLEADLASRETARLALERASEDCRELLKAYFFEQRSYTEIAQALGVPIGTVKSRLVRCLQKAHRALHGGSPEGETGDDR